MEGGCMERRDIVGGGYGRREKVRRE